MLRGYKGRGVRRGVGVWRANGASERSGTGEEADEAWRGHGCAVPLQGKMRPSAWAKL